MGTVLPINLLGTKQPQIGLIDQRGGLEGVSWVLAVHVPPGKPAQFLINDRKELV